MSSTRIRWGAALLALGFIAVTLLVTSGSESNDEVPSESRPATASEPATPSEHSDIYVVDVESRQLGRLTDNGGEKVADSPSWSDAGKIAFGEPACERCASRLFATDAEGSGRERISSDVENVYQPAWSPDGREIAAARPGSGIYVIDVRDGRTHRLSRGASDGAPAWSPDGKLILFQRQVTATNWDIYGVRPGGGGLRRLTHDPLQQLHPTWSPDGRRIAFTEQHSNGNWVVFTTRVDGTKRRQVTDEHRSSQEPSWSPDGERIAFIAQAGERAAVAVIDADGGSWTRLTSRSLAASGPAWSPDGKKVAFAAHTTQKGAHHP
jgi:Tol biopolymer transport system component